jgi:hypothetical protein
LTTERGFIRRLRPAIPDGGFRLKGYWVWCGSVVRGEDGRYHMFASRWPKDLRFPHWLTNSEVVRATSDRPEGPYEFAEVVLPARGETYWDGRMTHNPTIHRGHDAYLLFYIGTTYRGATPTAEAQARPKGRTMGEARVNQRIGLATAKSVTGPWSRRDAPILEPRPGEWDALMTNNPAPCVLPDGGGVLLVYKSTHRHGDPLRLGVAGAAHPAGPYERLKDEPVFQFGDARDHLEDPYVWREGNRFQMLMKDISGAISGQKGGGIHATSGDGTDWSISDPPDAYSLTIPFADGTQPTFARVERPQLMLDGDGARMLFVAVADQATRSPLARTWNQPIPLARA